MEATQPYIPSTTRPAVSRHFSKTPRSQYQFRKEALFVEPSDKDQARVFDDQSHLSLDVDPRQPVTLTLPVNYCLTEPKPIDTDW